MLLSVNDTYMIIANPVDYSILDIVPITSVREIEKTIEKASSVYSHWRRYTVKERIKYIRPFLSKLLVHRDELVDLVIKETGKTKQEAKQEINDTVCSLRYHLSHAEQFLADEMSCSDKGNNYTVIKEPKGVVAIITPCNSALLELEIAVIPCLLSGNVVVYKPSENAILLCRFAVELLNEQLPTGVLGIVCGDGETGKKMIGKKFDFFYYVGAVRVDLYHTIVNHFVGSVTHMGGSSPAIIFEDVEITDSLASDICNNRFYICGQTCNSINRLFVHESLYDKVVEAIVRFVRKIRIGDPHAEETQMGCICSRASVDILKTYVDDAIKKGAITDFCGRNYYNNHSNFFPPVILLNTTKDMLVRKEPNFGPLLPIIPFHDDSEVLQMANETDYGLAAYIFTNNKERQLFFCEELQCSRIFINTIEMGTSKYTLDVPFGVRKLSGEGYNNGKYIFDEFTRYKSFVEKVRVRN